MEGPLADQAGTSPLASITMPDSSRLLLFPGAARRPLRFAVGLTAAIASTMLPGRACASSTAWPAPPADTVHYDVRIPNPATGIFELTFTLRANAGMLVVHLPATTPGDVGLQEHARFIDRFSAIGAAGRPLRSERVGLQTWTIAVPAPMQVLVSYRVHRNHRDRLRLATNWLDERGGFLDGTSLFLYADGHVDDPVQVRYHLPVGWAVATTLPRSMAGTYLASGYRALVDAPAQFGELRERRVPLEGLALRLIFDGSLPPYDTAAFDAAVKAIMLTEVRLFGARPFSEYTVFLHWRPDLEYGGGIEHGNAMVLNVGSGWMPDLPTGAAGTIAHEAFHAWNGKAFYPRALALWDFSAPNYSRHLWFVEGVTSYFAQLTLVRAGIRSPDRFFEMMSRSMTAWENDDGRGWMSLAEAGIAQWAFSPDVLDYYGDGAVAGFLLDLSIRLETGGTRGLDDVLRTLYRESRKAGYRGYDDALLQAAVTAVTGRRRDGFFSRFVTARTPGDYRPILERAGLRVSRTVGSDGKVRIVVEPSLTQTSTQIRLWRELFR